MRKTLMIFLALVLVCGCGAAFAAHGSLQLFQGGCIGIRRQNRGSLQLFQPLAAGGALPQMLLDQRIGFRARHFLSVKRQQICRDSTGQLHFGSSIRSLSLFLAR